VRRRSVPPIGTNNSLDWPGPETYTEIGATHSAQLTSVNTIQDVTIANPGKKIPEISR